MSNDDLHFDPNEPVREVNRESFRVQRAVPVTAPSAPLSTARPRPQQRTAPAAAAPAPAPIPVAKTAPKTEAPMDTYVVRERAPAAAVAAAEVVSTRVTRPEAIVARPSAPVDARYEDISLPSQFVAYPFKQLAVRRFTVAELRAVVRARVSGNMRHLVRALDNTITQDVYALTVGDFWFIMYWHRLNSYKKSPFVITWTCDNNAHLHAVEKHEKEPKSLSNLTTIQRGDLKVTDINVDVFERLADAVYAEHQVGVQPQMLVDFLAALDEEEILNQRMQDAQNKTNVLEQLQKDPDLDLTNLIEELTPEVEAEERSFMYRYAALLTPAHGQTLDERCTALDTHSPDLLQDLEEVLQVVDHGVVESFNVKCKGCGASKTVNQSLDALTFLPSLQRGGFV